ncbi:MAG: CRISPR-associated helicase Cas3' [Clostridia bacterium]|nr:CRISPR-associated helicase Cas3' [Clostridia bacterium]
MSPAWNRGRDTLSGSFYTRMLFSCLVDADYLDTEAFMQGTQRQPSYASLTELLQKVKAFTAGWYPPKSAINEKRCAVLDDCEKAGLNARGMYTLSVPTGGGKTIASLLFALTHAVQHGASRVIYVIPYTSIIEQNAAVFANILGAENVLEHHSSAEYPDDDSSADEESRTGNITKRLATENWDAPVIVTTAVQFFESLYAAKTSRCRKLHSIANSVVIFDESQMIPLDFLLPCVYAMAELVRHYNTTAVLCTATQPALDELIAAYLPNQPIREIVSDRKALYEYFRRVTYVNEGKLSLQTLSQRLCSDYQALCIVNSRKTAREIYEALPTDSRFHLSTWMTPRDRRQILRQVRDRLKDNLPCHLVSTSLIEAGVDLDFPAVWREESGLDSILQAGGRCNREGKRPTDESLLHIFSALTHGQRQLQPRIDACRYALESGRPLDDPDTVHAYFLALLKTKGEAIDKHGILEQCSQFNFQTVAQRFQLIDDQQSETVYLPTTENEEWLQALRDGRYTRSTIRKLQQDSISVSRGLYEQLLAAGKLELTSDGFAILTDADAYVYGRGIDTVLEEGQAFFA